MVTQIPDIPVQISLTEASEEDHGHQMHKLTMEPWQEKLFGKLDLSSLESWALELAAAAQSLLAIYHNIFSLEPSEFSCSTQPNMWLELQVIPHLKNVLGGYPGHWKKKFTCILWEMLDLGTLHLSQSAWCNGVVLVQKKDGGLCFCIDFWHLNTHTKKDSYPLPRIQKELESLLGAGYFSCPDLKSGFWQIQMDESSKQYIVFTIGNLSFFKCDHMPFGLCNAPATFQWLMQNCLGELNLIHCLIYLDDIVVFS